MLFRASELTDRGSSGGPGIDTERQHRGNSNLIKWSTGLGGRQEGVETDPNDERIRGQC